MVFTMLILPNFLLFTVIAISPNNNEIHIYETTNWTRLYLLSEVIIAFFTYCSAAEIIANNVPFFHSTT